MTNWPRSSSRRWWPGSARVRSAHGTRCGEESLDTPRLAGAPTSPARHRRSRGTAPAGRTLRSARSSRVPIAEHGREHREIVRARGRRCRIAARRSSKAARPSCRTPFADSAAGLEQQNRRALAEQLPGGASCSRARRELALRHSRQRQIDVCLRESRIGLHHVLVLHDRLVQSSGEVQDAPDTTSECSTTAGRARAPWSSRRARRRTARGRRETSRATGATARGRD